ncbi:MAG: glycoside hydrolase family 2 protein [Gemmatimonadaceae bacterium]
MRAPRSPLVLLILGAGIVRAQGTQPAAAQTPPAPMLTRWARDVTPDRVLPEYPRPQMVRPAWQSLNGRWDYAIRERSAPMPTSFDGTILVPFPVESQLSGVRRNVSELQRLWYHRVFRAPALRSDRRLLLHFGAVDWECSILVNGTEVGSHRGGYDPFTVDITTALRPGDATQDISIAVWDPTDADDQPRGKQVRKPHGIFYTAVTGIWQTVWLEVVPAAHITALDIAADIDAGTARLRVASSGAPAGTTVRVIALDGRRIVAEATSGADEPIVLHIPHPKLWSPSSPFLYGLRVQLSTGDAVKSYVGMRKIGVAKDSGGTLRLFLNNRPLFQLGWLDQGWWPDGLYTAPTDAALRFDIEIAKRLGFNLARKHVKVEPERWYYHCDRLGLLVWQDMPSAVNELREGQSARGSVEFTAELERVIDALRNHPSIVMWVPFNEGWGQHETERYVSWIQRHDSTRLVNNASGWTDTGTGDVEDIHAYPGPSIPAVDGRRATVLGEYGGLRLLVPGHMWSGRNSWGSPWFSTRSALFAGYRAQVEQLRALEAMGLAASIYTQITDVETEVNGVLTYDRAVVKLPQKVRALHASLFGQLPVIRTIMPSSREKGQRWRYTIEVPPQGWTGDAFDDSGWREGLAGFGSPKIEGASPRTAWTTSDLWIRRAFDLQGELPAHPRLLILHDDVAEIFINGARVAEYRDWTTGYMLLPVDSAAARAIHRGRNSVAVHVRNTGGEQFIDVGIVDVAEPLAGAAHPKRARHRSATGSG